MTTEARRDDGAVNAARALVARVLVARVGSEYFAFPLTDVLEALDAPVVTTVPLTPKGVLGQFTHRGQLLPVLDPHLLLGVPLDAESARGTMLVMVPEGTPFALAVDDVSDMVTVRARDRRSLPEGADPSGMLAGLFAIDHMLVAAVEMTAFRATAATLLTTGT